MKNWQGCLFMLLIAVSPFAFAEVQTQNQPPLPLTSTVSYDSLRIMVRDGYIDQAIPLAVEYLKHEEDADVRTLLGRMYYLKNDYPEAKEQYEIVLRNKPNGYTDASLGLINVYISTNDYQSALIVVNNALNKNSSSEDLINKKRQILNNLTPGAAGPTTSYQPSGREPAQEFIESGAVITEIESGANQENEPKNLIWIDKEYSYVSDLKETWELTTLSYTRYTPYGSIIGRYNYAYRFGVYGEQYELDMYPHLFSGGYLYMSYGYSQDTSIFPRNRTGLEAFFSLPEAFEFSFGIRTLHFTTTVFMYTGSIGKYIGDYWIAYRPYIVDGVTNYLTIRRYFSTADSYMSLTLGTGYGENFYSLALPNTIAPNKSTSIRLDGQLPINDNLLFTWVVENSLNQFPSAFDRTETDLELGFIWRY